MVKDLVLHSVSQAPIKFSIGPEKHEFEFSQLSAPAQIGQCFASSSREIDLVALTCMSATRLLSICDSRGLTWRPRWASCWL